MPSHRATTSQINQIGEACIHYARLRTTSFSFARGYLLRQAKHTSTNQYGMSFRFPDQSRIFLHRGNLSIIAFSPNRYGIAVSTIKDDTND